VQRECVCLCVFSFVEAMHVFLSEPWINVGTVRRVEMGLLVGWDGIRGTSVESMCVCVCVCTRVCVWL